MDFNHRPLTYAPLTLLRFATRIQLKTLFTMVGFEPTICRRHHSLPPYRFGYIVNWCFKFNLVLNFYSALFNELCNSLIIKPQEGFEPPTRTLQRCRSTPELLGRSLLNILWKEERNILSIHCDIACTSSTTFRTDYLIEWMSWLDSARDGWRYHSEYRGASDMLTLALTR